MLGIDHVHGSRPSTVQAGLAAEQLGDEGVWLRPHRQEVTVPSVGARDAIAVDQRAREADRDGLLTGVEVRGAVDLTVEEQALDAILDAADDEHPPVEVERERHIQLCAGCHRFPRCVLASTLMLSRRPERLLSSYTERLGRIFVRNPVHSFISAERTASRQ